MTSDGILHVRPAIRQDIETIAEFNVALARDTEDKELSLDTVRKGVTQGFERPESCQYFVALSGERLVGQLMLTFEWSDWRAGFFWWIQSVYVLKEARGQGIFRALYDEVLARARQDSEQCCGVRLYVDQDNEHAMSVYDNVGMCRSGYYIYEVDWS